MGAAESVADLRIVLVGKTGNGKSATGNSILGREAFESKMYPKSLTVRCEKATGILPDGRTVAVIDTPGFFNTKTSQTEIVKEVKRCMDFCSPGPHVIIHVIRLGRFSEEDRKVAELLNEIFTLRAKSYMIILVTRKEDLEGCPLHEMLSEDNDVLLELRKQIQSCGNRCLAFNNKAKGRERQDQVDELIRMVDKLVDKNEANPFYTKQMMQEDKSAPPVADLRIVLVGKTGNGKSATGNSILGREAFESMMKADSVTVSCGEATGTLWDGRTVAVIDTPGFFDTKTSQMEIIKEVKKCVEFCSPGPHVIIQVIRLGHFSKEERKVAEIVNKIFTLRAKSYMIVLFTRKEDLEGRPLREVLSEENAALQELKKQIQSCGNRFLAFNNGAKGRERQDQVDELIRMVDELVDKNKGNPFYTKEMMEEDKKSAPPGLCNIL